MDNTLRDFVKGLITEQQLTNKLQLNVTQLIYIKQEVQNYRFGESSLDATVERIKQFI